MTHVQMAEKLKWLSNQSRSKSDVCYYKLKPMRFGGHGQLALSTSSTGHLVWGKSMIGPLS